MCVLVGSWNLGDAVNATEEDPRSALGTKDMNFQEELSRTCVFGTLRAQL